MVTSITRTWAHLGSVDKSRDKYLCLMGLLLWFHFASTSLSHALRLLTRSLSFSFLPDLSLRNVSDQEKSTEGSIDLEEVLIWLSIFR
jgi:hypothetical protein